MTDREGLPSIDFPVTVFLCLARVGHVEEVILTLKNETETADLISNLKADYAGNMISIPLKSGNEFVVDPNAILYLYRLPNSFAYSHDTVVIE